MNKLYIHEDISDWRDEALRNETIFTSKSDIIDALDNGLHTNQIGRAAIVSREMSKGPDDLLRPNKILIMAGATGEVIEMARAEKITIETEAGKKIKVSAYVGPVRIRTKEGEEIETDDKLSYVRADDPLAIERSEAYLLRVVPGYIRGRLALILAAGGSVEGAADDLKDKIDEIVESLS